MTEILAVVIAIGSGAGAAAVSAAVGYLKSWSAEGGKLEKFDHEKALYTVTLGAVLGGIAGGAGITVIDAQNLLVSLGLFSAVVYFVEAGAKAIVRYFRARWRK